LEILCALDFAALTLAALLLASAAPSFAASASYTYDALGRMVQVTYPDTGTTIVYNYDAAGNRTAKTITCGTAGC
jgi:YD repeat-containing protein